MIALQKLFGEMAHSMKEWVDTEALAQCLQLDGGIQQDVHEFYKLIIDFLEVCILPLGRGCFMVMFYDDVL